MQIFTFQQILEMLTQSRKMAQEFFGIILRAIWENITGYFPTLWDAILTHNWPKVFTYALILIASLLFHYRLVRKNFLTLFRSMSAS